MKKLSIGFIFCVAFMILITALFGSCGKKKPEKIRQTKERYITVINKTGHKLLGYGINTASGVEIQKGKTSDDSFSIKIGNGFKNDSEIEVVLEDEYKIIYAKTFFVPLEGNTDTPVSAEDRKKEGYLTEKWKDLEAWFNENK